jgi:hypothetical protein
METPEAAATLAVRSQPKQSRYDAFMEGLVQTSATAVLTFIVVEVYKCFATAPTPARLWAVFGIANAFLQVSVIAISARYRERMAMRSLHTAVRQAVFDNNAEWANLPSAEAETYRNGSAVLPSPATTTPKPRVYVGTQATCPLGHTYASRNGYTVAWRYDATADAMGGPSHVEGGPVTDDPEQTFRQKCHTCGCEWRVKIAEPKVKIAEPKGSV